MVRYHHAWEIPHVVQRYLAAVDGIQDGDYRPLLFLDNGKSTKIHEEIKEHAKGRGVVGIAPGAGRHTKIWSVEKMQKLMRALTEKHGLLLIFLGAESDVHLVDAVCRDLHGGYLNLAGKTDFRELGIYLASCDAALTTDSGPMHVAGAVGTPVVSLFGPTVAEFGFRPYDEQSVTISVDLPCRPCSLHGGSRCPRGHHRCMEEIEVAAVEEAILGLLDQNAESKQQAKNRKNDNV